MKILIVNYSDTDGGASVGTFKLFESLQKIQVNIQMLVGDKKKNNDSIIGLNEGKLSKISGGFSNFYRKTVNKLLVLKYKRTKTNKFGAFSVQKANNRKLVRKINAINPDIVHLNWICKNFLSIEDISKINAPIVWSLRDMWAYTGGCHYVSNEGTGECEKYIMDCGKCSLLGSKKQKDLSFSVLQKKKKSFAGKDMTLIGLSRWMADCAKKSAVFADKKVVNLPNCINTTFFKPLPKDESRKYWKLPENKKLILFGAVSATSRAYKGFSELIEALNKVNTDNIECVVFGANKPNKPINIPCKINYLGYVSKKIDLVNLYCACDIVIVPSLRENLSNVIMEALSCGVPVACFDIGGNSDMVEHKKNGYLTKPFDTDDLAFGIDWILDVANYEKLQKYAREKITVEFDYSVVAPKYLKLYEEILQHK